MGHLLLQIGDFSKKQRNAPRKQAADEQLACFAGITLRSSGAPKPGKPRKMVGKKVEMKRCQWGLIKL